MLRPVLIALPATVAAVAAVLLFAPAQPPTPTPQETSETAAPTPRAADEPEPAEQTGTTVEAGTNEAGMTDETMVEEPAPEPPEAPIAAIPHPLRNVTPPGIYSGPVRVPRPEEPQAAEPAPEPDARTYRRVIVEEAGAIRAGDTRIRLAGITAPDADSTCTDAAGETWPCGRAAAAALRLLVRNRAVECEILDRTDGAVVGDCAVAGRPLSAWLIEQGWAEPTDETRYREAAETAREEGRGIHAAAHGDAPPPVSMPAPFRAPAVEADPAPPTAPGGPAAEPQPPPGQ